MMGMVQRGGLAALLPSVIASVLFGGLSVGQPVAIRWIRAASGRSYVEVTGLDAATLQKLTRADWGLARWQSLLSVYVEKGRSSGGVDLPPVAGTHRVSSGGIRFDPQFPLQAGVAYRATFRPGSLPARPGSLNKTIESVMRMPARIPAPSTFVTHVFPTASVVPENLLKFYIHFSAPMSRGRIYDHIHLRTADGKAVELPFLEIDEELWNPAMTRLTLFIDPGRIKQGVKPLVDIGPALQEGKKYTLEIDGGWHDGAGSPLKQGMSKHFTVGPPDREPIDLTRWVVESPPNRKQVLVVTFPKPIDHALAMRLIRVTDCSGKSVRGHYGTYLDDRRWAFAPAETWKAGTYYIVVGTTLEDLAGNNIGKPFEVDLFNGVDRKIENETIKLRFEVR